MDDIRVCPRGGKTKSGKKHTQSHQTNPIHGTNALNR